MFSFNRNLRYPETGYNKILDEFCCKTKMTVDMNLCKWNTNCNFHILDKVDKSFTSGKVTCIPIDYLRKEYGGNAEYEDEKKEKEIYFNKFLKNEYNLNDLEKIIYKDDIKLSDFFKPYLTQSDLSKTVDYAKIDVLDNDLSKELGTVIGVYDKPTISRPKISYRNEWMSATDIKDFLRKVSVLEDDIFLIDLIYIEKKKSFYETSSYFYNSHFKHQLCEFKNSKKRFLLSIILYNSHFNAVIVDKKFKKKKKNGIVYMFDSQGFDKKSIYYNKNFFFLNSNMDQKKQKYNDLENSSQENFHVDILTTFFRDEFNINLVLMNKFVIQLLNSECGMFSMVFLYLNIINKPYTISSALKNYLTMIFKGDLTISQIRGMFFVTNEDRAYSSYMKSLDSYMIKNRKYIEFKNLENKKDNYIKKVYENILTK